MATGFAPGLPLRIGVLDHQQIEQMGDRDKLRGKLNEDGTVTLFVRPGGAGLLGRMTGWVSGRSQNERYYARQAVSALLQDRGVRLPELGHELRGAALSSPLLLKMPEPDASLFGDFELDPEFGDIANQVQDAAANREEYQKNFQPTATKKKPSANDKKNWDSAHLSPIAKTLAERLIAHKPALAAAPDVNEQDAVLARVGCDGGDLMGVVYDALIARMQPRGQEPSAELDWVANWIASAAVNQALNAPGNRYDQDGGNGSKKALMLDGVNHRDLQRPLGSSVAASVHLFENEDSGELVALKSPQPSGINFGDFANVANWRAMYTKEARLHQFAQSGPEGDKYIIGFKGMVRDTKGLLHIAMESAPGGDGNKLIERLEGVDQKSSAMAGDARILALRDMARGLRLMHDKGMLHLDIKPANFLLGTDGVMKLTDFGTSQALPVFSTSEKLPVQHPRWLAPEAVVYEMNRAAAENGHATVTLTQAADVWSLGICAFEMFQRGDSPFPAKDVEDAEAKQRIKAYFEGTPPGRLFDGHWDEAARDLVQRMLDPRPENRPNLTEVLGHELFARLDEERERVARAYLRSTVPSLPASSQPAASSSMDASLSVD